MCVCGKWWNIESPLSSDSITVNGNQANNPLCAPPNSR